MSSLPVIPVVREGEVVSGKFRVERLVGEGAVGLVLEATHLQLDERVALKFLRSEVMDDTEVVERFAAEARAAVKLRSEHVARVLDVGHHGKLPYMVMEFLEGQNLDDMIAQRGQLDIAEAVELVIQAAEGISEAHARGIVHRDVKPANLFLAHPKDGWPTLKVLDFGISKAALGREGGKPANDTRSMVGSPYYMSPEQIRAASDVDRRTDIWSLGAVLFELCTGQTAFAAQDFDALMREILADRHRRLRDLRSDAPAELETVIDRCLAKKPDARFGSAAELALALLPFTESKRARVIATRAASLTRSSGIDPDLPVPSTIPPPRSSRPAERSSADMQTGSVAAMRSSRTGDRDGARSFATTDAESAKANGGGGRRVALALVALALIIGTVGVVVKARSGTDPSAPGAPEPRASTTAPSRGALANGATTTTTDSKPAPSTPDHAGSAAVADRPAASAERAGTSAPTGEHESDSTTTAPKAAAAMPGLRRPAGRGEGATSAKPTATPPRDDLDIRRER